MDADDEVRLLLEDARASTHRLCSTVGSLAAADDLPIVDLGYVRQQATTVNVGHQSSLSAAEADAIAGHTFDIDFCQHPIWASPGRGAALGSSAAAASRTTSPTRRERPDLLSIAAAVASERAGSLDRGLSFQSNRALLQRISSSSGASTDPIEFDRVL